MMQLEGEEPTTAAKRIYELCDVAHKHNREPMVATGKYDVLNPLATCLLHDNPEKVHFVCLTLNNLAIPHKNKQIMCLERISKKIFTNLCTVIASGRKEVYLCLICLMNLSFYEPAQVPIGQFSPQETNGTRRWSKVPPLENPNSLLRILQDLTLHAARGTADFRWAFALLASLANHPENALLIGLTAIPTIALENLSCSKQPPSQWDSNSLEDSSLFLILHLAEISDQGLEEAVDVVAPIMMNDTSVQGLKATVVCSFLNVSWSAYPNYGVIATGSVTELMTNAFEQREKKNAYDSNVFHLKTAIKAYGDLARAASKADVEADDQQSTHAKVVALPTAIAVLFEILEETTLHGGDEDYDVEESGSDARWDLQGDLAAGAILSLLPVLLQTETPPRRSVHTKTACVELGSILRVFAQKSDSIPGKAKASEAAEKISGASHSVLPLLEASYDLWRQAKQ